MGIAALVFLASAAVTVAWCGSMSAMPGMEMPGGWTMSMAWMRMPGQSWSGAAATYLGMWTVMMIAMMLPALTPVLARYRAARLGDARLNAETALVAAGYFSAWTLFGAVTYPLGVALAEAAMRVPELSRVVPRVGGAFLAIAGALQFTPWKARLLACCRASPARRAVCGARESAWRTGLRLGARCMTCCLGPTGVLLVIGVMDLGAMALITAAISLERLAPNGWRFAQLAGVFATAAGLWMAVFLHP